MTPDALRRAAQVRVFCASGEARRVREDARVSLREMAATVGVDHKTIDRWERGVRFPTTAHVAAYADALDALRDLEETA